MSWFRNLIGKSEHVAAVIEADAEKLVSDFDAVNKAVAKAEASIVRELKGWNVHIRSQGHIDKTSGGEATITISVSHDAEKLAAATAPVPASAPAPAAAAPEVAKEGSA
jgi:hypothetical protein